MKLHIYTLRNKDLGCYCNPVYDDRDAEVNRIALVRLLSVSEDKALLMKYKHMSFYELGVFDDDTGEITAHTPELIIDCDDILVKNKTYGKK